MHHIGNSWAGGDRGGGANWNPDRIVMPLQERLSHKKLWPFLEELSHCLPMARWQGSQGHKYPHLSLPLSLTSKAASCWPIQVEAGEQEVPTEGSTRLVSQDQRKTMKGRPWAWANKRHLAESSSAQIIPFHTWQNRADSTQSNTLIFL